MEIMKLIIYSAEGREIAKTGTGTSLLSPFIQNDKVSSKPAFNTSPITIVLPIDEAGAGKFVNWFVSMGRVCAQKQYIQRSFLSGKFLN
jgi:hypothetical protein